jgi:hypothetical protein
MKMTWDIIYIAIVTITLLITYIICIVSILKKLPTINQNYKSIYIQFLFLLIVNILLTIPIFNSKLINPIVNFISLALELNFLMAVFNKFTNRNKLIHISFYLIIALVHIHFVLLPQNDNSKLNYYGTIIYFLFSLLTLYFIKIYFKKTSSILNVISIKNDPLHILMIGIFFGYGLSLPIDAIYSYLILFEKPFFLQMVTENFKIFRVIKFSELVCFIILNIYIINSLKCFKPV